MEHGRHEERKRREEILAYIRPEGGIALLAMGMSALTVLTALAVLCPAWYETIGGYTEFITGNTTFSGYNKGADMRIVKILLVGIPVFYFLSAAAMHFLKRRVSMSRRTAAVFGTAYFFCLVLFMNGEDGSLFWGMTWLLVLVSYCILYCGRERKEGEFEEFILTGLVVYIALQSVFVGLYSAAHLNLKQVPPPLYQLPNSVMAVFLPAGACLVRFRRQDMTKIKRIAQLLVPAGLRGMVYFCYDYEGTGEVFTLFYSAAYRWLLYLLFVAFAGYALYGLVKRRSDIYLTTLLTAAMLRVFTRPEGILNIDFFHMGEMSTPFMQLEGYGLLPFSDLMPIHGLCDYYYSVIDYLFLDGSYLSMNAAMTVGNLFLAMFLAIVLYYVCGRKGWALLFVYCFIPFLVNTAGMRYTFLFATFFILLSEQVRKKGLRYIWWYVVLSILSVSWNMSIGGAGAAAFFPVAVVGYLPRAIRESVAIVKERRRRQLRLYGLLYIFLLCLGIAFIPSFLRIVGYLRENTGTTQMANGMAMIPDLSQYKEFLQPSFFQGQSASFLHVFGFLLPLLICVLFLFDRRSEELRSVCREQTVVLWICFYILVNYAFVRFDEGARAKVMSVFFLLASLTAFFGRRDETREETDGKGRLRNGYALLLCLFLFAMSLTGDHMGIRTEALVRNKEVPASLTTSIMGREVEDPVVYVTGDSVSMRRLGRGFIRGNTLQSLQNLKYVVDTELEGKQEYLDLTNAIANYVFLDARMMLPYTSGYNISNEQMQKRAIELLRKNEPRLVVLAPYIRFDEAPVSLRSPLLYEYLQDAGYVPYVYENVIYLKKEKSVLYDESNGFEAYAELMHKQALDMLPAVWGSSEAAIEALEPVAAGCTTDMEEDGLCCVIDGEYSGGDIDFVRIRLPDASAAPHKEPQLLQGESSEVEGENTLRLCFGLEGEEHEFRFAARGDSLLIPVFSSPYWKGQSEITDFSVCAPEDMAPPDWLGDVEITFYSWNK